MRKLKLDVEALEVESFEATPEPSGLRGTVKGHYYTEPWTANEPSVCVDASCAWTHCNNLSCLANCGSGGAQTYGQYTCDIRCNTSPPEIE
ncbi:MAG TPA: hypothetical protein VNP72_02560 [Longimicrobium sp.]|nr:hypothetical protein [Longimicrobium sp.]